MTRLSAADLATEADADPALIENLVGIGVLAPDDDGRFDAGDVFRVQAVRAGLAAGLSLDHLDRAIRERLLTLDHVHRYFLEPAPRSGRTYAEFAASLGERGRLLGRVYAAFGLAEPAAETRVRVDEERIVTEFVDIWLAVGDLETVVRAARLNGEATRRATEGIVALWDEMVATPMAGSGLDIDELAQRTLDPASRIARNEPELLVWLEQRHMEHAIDERNIAILERIATDRGWVTAREGTPPSVAFADISGFTTMTQTHGDELAARVASRLADLAADVAAGHDGRVVKLLGDGVMLRFDRPDGAVRAMLALTGRTAAHDLPPAHVGIHTGHLVERDGDIYGHTVNLASRIADRSGPGDVLVSDAVRAGVDGAVASFEPLGAHRLKGVTEPVDLYRVTATA